MCQTLSASSVDHVSGIVQTSKKTPHDPMHMAYANPRGHGIPQHENHHPKAASVKLPARTHPHMASVEGKNDDEHRKNNADDGEQEAHAPSRGPLVALRMLELRVGLVRVLRCARDVLLDVVHHLALVVHEHCQILRTPAPIMNTRITKVRLLG